MFKVGDKVEREFGPGMVGVGIIRYGPYIDSYAGAGSFLVEWTVGDLKGQCSPANSSWLKPAPRFEEGQVVRSSGLLCKVLAGPFKRETGSTWYVLEAPDGSQDMEYEAYMVPVVE